MAGRILYIIVLRIKWSPLLTAIKTGRYTHEKRTRDIEEVKKLEQRAKSKDDGSMLSLPAVRLRELDDMIEHITNVHLENTPHTPHFFATLPEREAKFLVCIM